MRKSAHGDAPTCAESESSYTLAHPKGTLKCRLKGSNRQDSTKFSSAHEIALRLQRGYVKSRRNCERDSKKASNMRCKSCARCREIRRLRFLRPHCLMELLRVSA